MSNTKHFEKGSSKPDFPDDGAYRLYSMRFCPYAARVHLVLDAKNLPYHTANINLNNKPEWLFDANRLGKVPAIQLVDRPGAPFVYESMFIAEYLDEVHPENKLYPSDPFEKLQEKLWIERFEAVATKFHQTFVDGVAAWNEILNGIDEFEKELNRRGTIYFGGDKPNVLDYAIWPWFPRTEVAGEIFADGCEFSEKRFPKLVNWYRTLLANDKAIQKYYFPKDVYVTYQKLRRAGTPNFDLLVQ